VNQSSFRTDVVEPIPTVAELHARHAEAARNRWKASGDVPPAPGQAPTAADARPDPGAERIDMASIPKVADLYEKHRRESLNRWKNSGEPSRVRR